MNVINVTPGMSSLLLGKQGENKSTKFLFDVSGWLEKYPGCTITLVNRRPYESVSYPCVLTTEDDGKRGWVINSADLAKDGDGEAELKCTLGDMIEKERKTWNTKIMKSLSGEGDAPEPWESVMDDIEALVGDAQDAAEDAEDAVEHYPKIEDGYWYVWDAANNTWANTNVQAQGPQGQTGQTGPAGSDGADGADGADGVTFTPSVDTDGYISWTNDGGKENPTTRNIRGPQGETGETGPAGSDGADGTDATPELITSDYSDLTFPVAAGTMCYHSGLLYKANQAIATSEEWTAAHWTQTTIEEEYHSLKTEINSKYEKPNTGIPASDLASGVIPAVPVQDIQINGTSILNAQGVANVPYASTTEKGVSGVDASFGILVNNNGKLYTYTPSLDEIKAGTQAYKPIVPVNQHRATFYGLAKAAGADMKDSANAVGVFTDDAKLKIQQMLGLWTPKAYWKGINDQDRNNYGQYGRQLDNVPINVWEEMVVAIYQTISENGKTIMDSNWGTLYIYDSINSVYIGTFADQYLRGDGPVVVHLKRFPSSLVIEVSQTNGNIDTITRTRDENYIDYCRDIYLNNANGIIKAGTAIEAYIHRFI